MQHQDYDKALLVAAVFQLAKSDDIRELVAIACTIRNWVVPRIGAAAPYRSYSEAISNFLYAYDTRTLPQANNPKLIDPSEGMLVQVDGIYANVAPDITSSHLFPQGARYFARTTDVQPGSWIDVQVLKRQDEHPLIGTWGAQQFFA